MAADSICRSHYVLLRILFIRLHHINSLVASFNNTLGMSYSCAHFEEHGSVELLGNLERGASEVIRFLRIRRLKHRNLGRDCVVTGVLLILRRVHSRVVRNADNHTAVYACVGHSKQWVSRNVESDVLHTASRALASERSAKGRLGSNLLVWSPFAVGVVKFSEAFRNLGTRSTRIAGNHSAAAVIKTARDSFVTNHKLFH